MRANTTVKTSAMTSAQIMDTPRPAAPPVSVRASQPRNERRSAAVCTRRAYSVDPVPKGLSKGSDGRPRCGWGVSTSDYERYHDEEWGRAVREERAFSAKLLLGGF